MILRECIRKERPALRHCCFLFYGTQTFSTHKAFYFHFRFTHGTKAYTLTETPSIFISGNYGASATITRSFYLALIYYSILNKHLYFPWASLAEPTEARALICALQVMHFLINHFLGIDVFQITSIVIVHYVLCITPQVGGAEKVVVKTAVEKTVAKSPVTTAVKTEVDQKPKESKKKK